LKKITILLLSLGLFLELACSLPPCCYTKTSAFAMYSSVSKFLSAAFGFSDSSNQLITLWPRKGSFVSFSGDVESFKTIENLEISRDEIRKKFRLVMTISREDHFISVRPDSDFGGDLDSNNNVISFLQPFEVRVSQSVSSDTALTLNGSLEKKRSYTFYAEIEDVNFPWPYQHGSTSLESRSKSFTQNLAWLAKDSLTFREHLNNSAVTSEVFLLKTDEVETVWDEFISNYKQERREEAERIHQDKKHFLTFLATKEKSPVEITVRIHKINGHTIR